MVRIPRIENRVREVVEGFGDQYFTKPEAVEEICRDQTISNMLTQVRGRWPGWPLDELLLEHIESRLTSFLQQTIVVAQTVNGPVKARIYENYPVGEGPRGWQRLQGMTANDLRVCIAARRVQVAGHERVIRVYEVLLRLLEVIGPTARVSDIDDQTLQQAVADVNNGP